MNLLGFLLILTCLPNALLDFAIPIWQTEKVRMEDAYKWIFQATRGGEHAVPDREMAEKYMQSEWKTLVEPSENEPLWQPLCKDESIGRLNLRPFRAKGGEISDLLEGFIESSREFKGGEKDFLAAWNELGKRLKKRNYGVLSRKDWKNLDKRMKKEKYPAIHHSKEYEESVNPAYRIVTGRIKQKILTGMF